MTRARTVAPRDTVVPVTVRGPHPLAVYEQSAVDNQAAAGLNGRTGSVRIGNSGGGYGGAFRGDLGPLQSFGRAGARASGANADTVGMRPPDPGTRGLPGTKVPDPDTGSKLLRLFARMRGES